MRIHKEHRIEVPQSRLLELLFDGEFQKRMNLEAMNSEKYEVLERKVDGDTWSLRGKVTPKDNMPVFIKKLVGGGFTMEDQITHKKGSDSISGTMSPSALRDKVHINYTLRLTPEGDNACRRVMDWDVEVKIFAVGGQIEKFIAGEIEKGMEASARYLSQQGTKAS